MTSHGAFDEARLADALVASDGAVADPALCPAPDRIWDAARGATGPAAMRVLLDHAARCADCALALRAAVELHAASGLGSPSRRKTPWSWLGATVLRPEAAFAYLLVLAVGFPVYRLLESAREPAASVMSAARVIGLESDVVARGAARSAPVVVDPAGSDAVVLRLFVEPDDLDAAAPLRVALSSGDRVLAAPTFAPGSVGESGTLDVTIDVRAVPRDVPLTLTVTAGAERVFHRSLVLAPHRER